MNKRAKFDFEIDFTNGGGIQGQDFRLDIVKDDTRGNARPVHSTLLREEILIAEHLCNLANVPDEGFTFSAVPPKFKGAGTFPVRAFAKVK